MNSLEILVMGEEEVDKNSHARLGRQSEILGIQCLLKGEVLRRRGTEAKHPA